MQARMLPPNQVPTRRSSSVNTDEHLRSTAVTGALDPRQQFDEGHLTIFQDYLRGLGRSDNTVSSYVGDIRTFLTAVEYSTPDTFAYQATSWLNGRRRRLAAKTIGRHMCSLKAFAVAMNLPTERLDAYSLPKPGRIDPHPLPEGMTGVWAMIEKADTDVRVLIALCGLAGLRITEARSIRSTSVDRQRMQISFRGKGDRERKVPMSKACWDVIKTAWLDSHLEGDRPLADISDRTARKLITLTGSRAGISRRVASHDLRATFATAMLHKGVNLRVIQEILGHSSIAVTERYLGVTVDEMHAAVLDL